jgi:tetratricopeptide (TPR) repeat protein
VVTALCIGDECVGAGELCGGGGGELYQGPSSRDPSQGRVQQILIHASDLQALTSGYRKPCKIVEEEQLTFTAIMLKRRAFALLKMGQLEDALSDIKIAIRAVPSTIGGDMHILQADIHLSAKSYDLALQAYQRGLSLLDPTAATVSQDVQIDNMSKLEHLARTQVIDNGDALDPFAHLPTELVELFLQIGMEQDEHFALRCTWVCRDWRRTVQAIPSVWRT